MCLAHEFSCIIILYIVWPTDDSVCFITVQLDNFTAAIHTHRYLYCPIWSTKLYQNGQFQKAPEIYTLKRKQIAFFSLDRFPNCGMAWHSINCGKAWHNINGGLAWHSINCGMAWHSINDCALVIVMHGLISTVWRLRNHSTIEPIILALASSRK